MKIYKVVLFILISYCLQACSTSTEEENEPSALDKTEQEEMTRKTEEENLMEVLNKLMEKQPNEEGVETVCTYCYSITERDLEACDSCGMAPNKGTYVLSHEDLRTLNTTICRSCSKIIPELAKTCKYCTTFQ